MNPASRYSRVAGFQCHFTYKFSKYQAANVLGRCESWSEFGRFGVHELVQTMLNFPKTLFNLSIEYQQDILNVYHMCKLDLVPTSDPNAAHTEWSNLFLAARKLLHRAPPIRDHEQRSSQAAMRMRACCVSSASGNCRMYLP